MYLGYCKLMLGLEEPHSDIQNTGGICMKLLNIVQQGHVDMKFVCCGWTKQKL